MFRNLICGALILSSLAYAALVLAVTFLSYGLPPCQSEEPVFWMRLGLGALLFVGGMTVWRVWSVSTLTSLVIGAAMPALVFAAHGAIDDWSAARQASCASRTLSEAMDHCEADPSHFVKSRNAQGREVVSLIAPGRTDLAWRCLQRWADYAEHPPKLSIDQSVYEAARQRGNPAEK